MFNVLKFFFKNQRVFFFTLIFFFSRIREYSFYSDFLFFKN